MGYLCNNMLLKGHYWKREDAKPHPLQENNWEEAQKAEAKNLIGVKTSKLQEQRWQANKTADHVTGISTLKLMGI